MLTTMSRPISPWILFLFSVLSLCALVLLSTMSHEQDALFLNLSSSPPIVEDDSWTVVTSTSTHLLAQACVQVHIIPWTNQLIIEFKRLRGAGERTKLCLRPAPSYDDFRKNVEIVGKFARIEVLVEDDGMWAAFDSGMKERNRMIVWPEVEGEIDSSCAKRRKDTKRKNPCTVNEIQFLRAASVWRKWIKVVEALGEESLVVIIRCKAEKNAIASLGDVPGHVRETIVRNGHRVLIKQIMVEHLGVTDSDRVERFSRMFAENAPTENAQIDAGYCDVFPKPHSDGSVASCLPTFLIVGAQKAATDEVSVWLNFNPYHRRIDGGVETHFFDCIGRALSKTRWSCRRLRNAGYHENVQPELEGAFYLSNINEVHGGNFSEIMKTPLDFTWKLENKFSVHLDDSIWKRYLQLGHLTSRMLHRGPTRTIVYDKSPAYLDIANPWDVVRVLPGIKLVMITRDPVGRLLSAYFQFCETEESAGAEDFDIAEDDPSQLVITPPKKAKLVGDTKNSGPAECSILEFEKFVDELILGKVDLSNEFIRTRGKTREDRKRIAFARAVMHGDYESHLREWMNAFWVENGALEKQLFIVDQWHFKLIPQAVIFAIESFVGSRGGQRHYEYHPRYDIEGGYYVLGDYSKSNHPTHKASMPEAIELKLKEFYKPYIIKYKAFLLEFKDSIQMGCVRTEQIPAALRANHPGMFNKEGNFVFAPWVIAAAGAGEGSNASSSDRGRGGW